MLASVLIDPTCRQHIYDGTVLCSADNGYMRVLTKYQKYKLKRRGIAIAIGSAAYVKDQTRRVTASMPQWCVAQHKKKATLTRRWITKGTNHERKGNRQYRII